MEIVLCAMYGHVRTLHSRESIAARGETAEEEDRLRGRLD